MAFSQPTNAALVSCAFLLAAYIYYRHENTPATKVDLVQAVLDGLLRAEAEATVAPDTKIAVGFGSCVDILGEGLKLMEKIGISIPDEPENYNELHNMNELLKTFAYFFMHGASAGRVVKNETFFSELKIALNGLPETRILLGGNAPVMSSRFSKEGIKVLLAAPVPNSMKENLSSGISVVGGGGLGNDNEDTHLILEYQRNALWGKYEATRANRFIIYNEAGNDFHSLFNAFEMEIEKYRPKLLVVGGLRMMLHSKQQENGDSGLSGLKRLLTSGAVSRSTRIHLEMSSFPKEHQLKTILENAVYYADSIGMNEQELPNVRSILVAGRTTPVSDSHPRIAVTLDHMRRVFEILRATEETDGRRKLSRLHVHTLAYQVIMTSSSSSSSSADERTLWKNSKAAAAKASLTAHRHTCGSETIHPNKTVLLVDESFSTSSRRDDDNDDVESLRIFFDRDDPVACWTEEKNGLHVCLAPGLVCTQVVQTVGGGDNVSAAGLVLQV